MILDFLVEDKKKNTGQKKAAAKKKKLERRYLSKLPQQLKKKTTKLGFSSLLMQWNPKLKKTVGDKKKNKGLALDVFL